jgi:hypothetical protein
VAFLTQSQAVLPELPLASLLRQESAILCFSAAELGAVLVRIAPLSLAWLVH